MQRAKASLAVALLLLISGCLGGVLASPDISAAEAKAKAAAHHDEQTRSFIDHYDSSGAYQPSAEVVNATTTGYYVHVTQEYFYTSGEREADRINEATYFVNETTIRQVY